MDKNRTDTLIDGADNGTTSASDAWDRIASGYDRFVTSSHLSVASEALRRAGLQPGMRFVDVAAGSGALSIPAARRGACVLATDFSPVMLERLAARAKDEKLDIETRVMDGQALALPDASVDVAGSQFGVMLFPDMPKGMSEMARVAKPGGRVLVNVLGAPTRVEFFTFFIKGIQAVRPDFAGPPMNPPLLPFQLQDPERLREELETVGLTDVEVDTVAETLEFASGQQLWDWLVCSNPICEHVLGRLDLSEEEIQGIREALERMVRDRAGAAPTATLTVPVHIGVGTK